MSELHNGAFAPLTDEIGFLFANVDSVVNAYRQLTGECYPNQETKVFDDFLTALANMEPLNSPRMLFAETNSDWTAVFESRDRMDADLRNLSNWINAKYVRICYVEDTFNAVDGSGIPGTVLFELADGPDLRRSIYVGNDCEAWEFGAHGPIQKFEQPDSYRKRNVRSRFTREMLGTYCQALGINAFNESFYGPYFVVVKDYGEWYPNTGRPILFRTARERGLIGGK